MSDIIACDTGKITYPNRGTARKKLRRIKRAGRITRTSTLDAYWCRKCGFWHLGNRGPYDRH